MRFFWIVWVCPKSNDKCPYERQRRSRHTGEKRGRPCEGGDRRMQPQAKESLEAPDAERDKEGFSLWLWKNHSPTNPLVLGLWPSIL